MSAETGADMEGLIRTAAAAEAERIQHLRESERRKRELSDRRDELVRELLARGLSSAEVAGATGVRRQDVYRAWERGKDFKRAV